MQKHFASLGGLALAAALMLGGVQPVAAQNSAAQIADLGVSGRQATGQIRQVDALGGIIVVDGITYVLRDRAAAGGLRVGQTVDLTFERSNAGTLRRATRITPR